MVSPKRVSIARTCSMYTVQREFEESQQEMDMYDPDSCIATSKLIFNWLGPGWILHQPICRVFYKTLRDGPLQIRGYNRAGLMSSLVTGVPDNIHDQSCIKYERRKFPRTNSQKGFSIKKNVHPLGSCSSRNSGDINRPSRGIPKKSCQGAIMKNMYSGLWLLATTEALELRLIIGIIPWKGWHSNWDSINRYFP